MISILPLSSYWWGVSASSDIKEHFHAGQEDFKYIAFFAREGVDEWGQELDRLILQLLSKPLKHGGGAALTKWFIYPGTWWTYQLTEQPVIPIPKIKKNTQLKGTEQFYFTNPRTWTGLLKETRTAMAQDIQWINCGCIEEWILLSIIASLLLVPLLLES